MSGSDSDPELAQPGLREPDGHCELCAHVRKWMKYGVPREKPIPIPGQDPVSKYDEKFYLGTLKYAYDHRESCAMLDFAWKVFESTYDPSLPGATMVPQENTTQCYVGWWDHQRSFIRKDWLLFIKYESVDSQYVIRDELGEGFNIRLLEEDVRRIMVRETTLGLPFYTKGAIGFNNLGRYVSAEECDWEWARRRLHACETTHSVQDEDSLTTKREDTESGLPENMKLVDVEAACVVDRPPRSASGLRYATLSYVWGHTNSLTLNKDTRKPLHTPGALRPTRTLPESPSSLKVPKTIADAMEAARRLGFRYLWVDSICITQDDDALKMSQIRRMNYIYTGAQLTIVDGDGSHADAGLPGVRAEYPRSVRQIRMIMDGPEDPDGPPRLRFVASFPEGSNVIRSNAWSTRGWTYQEEKLSRRLLYFTNEQMVLDCQHNMISEDHVPSTDWAMKNDGSMLLQPCENGENRRHREDDTSFYSHKHPSRLTAMDPLSDLLRTYSQRQLTNSDDAINAFSGVWDGQPSSSKGGSGRMFCGLPAFMLFEMGLQWYHEFDGSQRQMKPMKDGSLFPSWSWAGWTGGIWFFYDMRLCPGEPSVDTWVLEDHRGQPLISSEEIKSQEHRPRKEYYSAADIQTGILRFEAECVTLHVELEQFRYSPDLTLYDIFLKGSWVGILQIGADTHRNETRVKKFAHATFLLLSVGPVTRPVHDRKQPTRQYGGVEAAELQYPEGACNMLFVEWAEDGETCSRRGVGWMDARVWREAKPQQRKVKLV